MRDKACPDTGEGRRGDAGITMIELIVTLALASILMTIGILAMKSYLASNRQVSKNPRVIRIRRRQQRSRLSSLIRSWRPSRSIPTRSWRRR